MFSIRLYLSTSIYIYLREYYIMRSSLLKKTNTQKAYDIATDVIIEHADECHNDIIYRW